ncbi:hypothetical protein [Desulfosarcina widdelii]|uniref:hypothetical protein n=1 Tax=Desulfosarcina widdelii TaxID=947919 RepID=UPI0012D2D6B5|nr:hypothetical protein [Desulfosarcina widdelii]
MQRQSNAIGFMNKWTSLWAVNPSFIKDLRRNSLAAVYLRLGGPAIFTGSSFGNETRVREPASLGKKSPVFGGGACVVTPFFHFHGQPHNMKAATEAAPNVLVRVYLKPT